MQSGESRTITDFYSFSVLFKTVNHTVSLTTDNSVYMILDFSVAFYFTYFAHLDRALLVFYYFSLASTHDHISLQKKTKKTKK